MTPEHLKKYVELKFVLFYSFCLNFNTSANNYLKFCFSIFFSTSAMTILTPDLIMHEKLDYIQIFPICFSDFFSLDFRDYTERMEINCKNKNNLMSTAE